MSLHMPLPLPDGKGLYRRVLSGRRESGKAGHEQEGLDQREGHDRLYITNYIFEGQRCLELYPPAEWEAVLERFRGKRGNRDTQLFETFYVGGAHEVPVDRQGRILIPTNLLKFARLDREVTFSAMQDHFQLWDKKILERVLKVAEEQMMDPEFFAKLGL